jgi:signal transduction histidine kinase
VQYADVGQVDLSIAGLVVPLLLNHARVKVLSEGSEKPNRVFQPDDADDEAETRKIYLSGLDVNIRKDPIVKRAAIPDTNVILEVSHPGVVIEKRVWLLLSGAIALVLLTAISCYYAFKRVLRPIYVWTSLSKQITTQGVRALSLPFFWRNDEIGTLAKSFNALLIESHRRVQREQAENDYRAEVLSVQEQNFQVIGHEIRSPLQALSAIITPEHEGRRYIDRILKALPFLERVYTTEDSITNREAKLRNIDLVAFVNEIVTNAPLIGIELFELATEVDVAICRVDPEALEDVLENLIRNANRHRVDDTPIMISLSRAEAKVLLSVTNYGDLIAEENLRRIFDFGFSTTEGELGRIAGIGLSISRHNILKMRGSLHVENLEPDRVRFTIALPSIA